MKKEYSAPKAEKLEFNYSEAVVACHSNTKQDEQTNCPPGTSWWKCIPNDPSWHMMHGVCIR